MIIPCISKLFYVGIMELKAVHSEIRFIQQNN